MPSTDRVRLKSLDWQEIAKRMKEDLENPPNKVEGSFASDNIQAVAKELAKFYAYIVWLVDMHFADTATGEFLDKKAQEVGIFRRKKTRSTGFVRFTGKPDSFIPAGLKVYAGTKSFYTLKPAYIGPSGYVDVEVASDLEGAGSNVGSHEIDRFQAQIGIESVTNANPISGGSEIEDDESLRERTLLRMRYPGTSGNQWHYLHWAREVDGVGRLKVFPLWNGPGTVKVSILDFNQKPASKDLIQKVQYHIDHEGERRGEALAPIGALLKVSTAKELRINIKARIDLDPGFGKTKTMIAKELKERLQAYIDSSVSYLQARRTVAKAIDVLYSIGGVLDIVEMSINGYTDSIALKDEEIFVVGDVSIS